jgi:protein phosphatase
MKPILATLVGISGSGKSTYATGLKTSLKIENGANVQIVETDAIRGELTNDPSDQSKNSEVFSIARQRVANGLKQGNNVVIDATSVSPKDRKTWIDIGKANNADIRAYFINTNVDMAKKQNLKRSRVVPDNVIDRQKSRLIPPSKSEGFDSIVVV